MIAAVGLGALLGGVLFALVLHVAGPRPAALVELARFDSVHTAGAEPLRTPAFEPWASQHPGPLAAAG